MGVKREINGDVATSYWIEKYDSGIIELCVNTVDRWIDYSISEYSKEVDLVNHEHLRVTVEVPELNIPINHTMFRSQNKDQISFYWIPNELITKGKIMERIKAKRNEES